MTVIHTNYSASIAGASLTQNKRLLGATMEQLSSGARINSAADDASGLAVSTRLTAQVRGLSIAIENAAAGVAMLDTIDSSLETKTNMLQRMRELGVQSLNGTLSDTERTYLNTEFRGLFYDLRDVARQASFNGKSILARDETITFQVGDSTASTFDFNLKNFSFDEFTSVYHGNLDISGGSVAVGDTIEVLGGIPFGSNFLNMNYAYSSDYPDQSLAARQAAAAYSGTITISDANIVSLMNSGDTSRETMDVISSYLSGELRKIEGFESAGVWWSSAGGFRYVDPFSSGYRIDIGSISSAANLGGGVVDPWYSSNHFHIAYNHVTKAAIEIVDARIQEILLHRAEVGSAMNALTSVVENLSSVKINAEASRSRVLDTDYAMATSTLAKSRIIEEAGLATLAQANSQPKLILSLLSS